MNAVKNQRPRSTKQQHQANIEANREIRRKIAEAQREQVELDRAGAREIKEQSLAARTRSDGTRIYQHSPKFIAKQLAKFSK